MVDIEKVRKHCFKKRGVTEGFPFDDETLVFKVMNKIFCLANLTPPLSINLKCYPELAVELREKYNAVTPGYHMNKTHWNTIALDGSVPNKEILSWIDHSYEIVTNGLTKKVKEELMKSK